MTGFFRAVGIDPRFNATPFHKKSSAPSQIPAALWDLDIRPTNLEQSRPSAMNIVCPLANRPVNQSSVQRRADRCEEPMEMTA